MNLHLFRIYPLFTFSLELNSFFYIPAILYMQEVYPTLKILANKTYLNHRNLLLPDLFSMELWNGFNYNPKNNSLPPLFKKKRLPSCLCFLFSYTKHNSSLKFIISEIVQVVLVFYLCYFTLDCRKE